MRIVCPSCGAAYVVPEERLVPGGMVRCARCQTEWPPVPEPPLASAGSEPDEPRLAEPPPPLEPVRSVSPEPVVTAGHAAPGIVAPSAEDRLVPLRPEVRAKRRRLQLSAAWTASVLALAVAGWLFVTKREDIMHAWPPSERAYAALGLGSKQ